MEGLDGSAVGNVNKEAGSKVTVIGSVTCGVPQRLLKQLRESDFDRLL